MRINSLVVAFGFLLIVGPAVASPPDAPKSFRDFVWGASPNKELKKIPVPSGGGIAIYQPRPDKTLLPLFKVPVAEEAYSFSKGRFFRGNAWVDGRENFEKIKAALVKKYGQPSVTDAHRNLRMWKWPDSPVEVRLVYDREFSRATVTYINTSLEASR